MANWIYNRLVAKGELTAIRKFLDAVKSGWQPLDFERIARIPELFRHAERVNDPGSSLKQWIDNIPYSEAKQLDALGQGCWRDWAFANWGTTQNACDVELDESTAGLGYVVITFRTARCPP